MTSFCNVRFPAPLFSCLWHSLSCATARLLDQTKALPRVQFPILTRLKINPKSADILNPTKDGWNIYFHIFFTNFNFIMTWLFCFNIHKDMVLLLTTSSTSRLCQTLLQDQTWEKQCLFIGIETASWTNWLLLKRILSWLKHMVHWIVAILLCIYVHMLRN